MFTKKQYEEFEELTTPLINWIKNLDDHEVTDYFYLYANAGQLYQVTFKEGI